MVQQAHSQYHSAPFKPYQGDLLGLAHDMDHQVYRWEKRDDCKILFSVTRKGNACSIHFASDPEGLRFLKEAIEDFIEFCFEYQWCRMVIGFISKPSVMRLAEKMGFFLVQELPEEDVVVYARCKDG